MRFGGGGLCRAGLFGGVRLLNVCSGGRGRRLHHNGAGRRRNHHHRRFSHHGACGRPGYHGPNGRARGNGRRRRRSRNNGRRRTRLGYDFARFRTGRRGRRRRGSNRRSRGRWMSRRCNRGRLRPHRHASVSSFGFLFLLLGQNGLQHVAGLGDVGEIDLGLNALWGARRRGVCVAAGLRGPLKLRANLVRLVVLKRTGVRLAAGQAELRQYVKNLPTLDFHLACQIVDSNLTHPPLFKVCCPRRLVAHSYLMAVDCVQNSIIA